MTIDSASTECPVCTVPLRLRATPDGIVWRCDRCDGVAANLAVVRRAAPRWFVKHLWLAAVQLSVASTGRCPSCRQPLREFPETVEVSPRCKVCCHCCLVWFDGVSVAELWPTISGDRAATLEGAGGAPPRLLGDAGRRVRPRST